MKSFCGKYKLKLNYNSLLFILLLSIICINISSNTNIETFIGNKSFNKKFEKDKNEYFRVKKIKDDYKELYKDRQKIKEKEKMLNKKEKISKTNDESTNTNKESLQNRVFDIAKNTIINTVVKAAKGI